MYVQDILLSSTPYLARSAAYQEMQFSLLACLLKSSLSFLIHTHDVHCAWNGIETTLELFGCLARYGSMIAGRRPHFNNCHPCQDSNRAPFVDSSFARSLLMHATVTVAASCSIFRRYLTPDAHLTLVGMFFSAAGSIFPRCLIQLKRVHGFRAKVGLKNQSVNVRLDQ